MNNPPSPAARLFWGVLCLVTFAGCAEPPRTVEVAGRVTLDGRPIERALVLFLSPYEGDQPAYGVTDADGRFELSTYFSKADIPLGAVPGEYAVVVEKRRLPNLISAMRKAVALGPGLKRQRYLENEAIWDVWPDGVPDGWPAGFIPNVTPLPKRLLEEGEPREVYNRLLQGVHLLPELYAQSDSTPFRVVIDRSQNKWTFDFDLETQP